MSRRRNHDEEYENHDRWLVSYADFITLLFAFFVVMYSLSSINEGKYRVLSYSLLNAFRSGAINPAVGQVVPSPTAGVTPATPAVVPPPGTARANIADWKTDARRAAEVRRMNSMAAEIRRVLLPLSREGQVRVTESARGISVEINASVLFAPGDATIDPAAVAALRAVAEVLAPTAFPIVVEGHTDSLPITTFRFPSNWELSAVRASTVVRLFIESGISPTRLAAAGYSDQRPVMDNATEEGRARNRRVAILIESLFADVPPPAVEAGA